MFVLMLCVVFVCLLIENCIFYSLTITKAFIRSCYCLLLCTATHKCVYTHKLVILNTYFHFGCRLSFNLARTKINLYNIKITQYQTFNVISFCFRYIEAVRKVFVTLSWCNGDIQSWLLKDGQRERGTGKQWRGRVRHWMHWLRYPNFTFCNNFDVFISIESDSLLHTHTHKRIRTLV